MDLAKVTASLLTNLRSLESLENFLLFAVEGFGDQSYRFQKSGLKEYTFRKKKATESGISLKEYSLKCNKKRTSRSFSILFSVIGNVKIAL